MKICFTLITFAVISYYSNAQEIQFTSGNNSWNPDTLGNQRAVVVFNGTGSGVFVKIPWRRRDLNPQDKRVIVVDAQTGRKIDNVNVLKINREFGEILFEPTSGSGNYYVYYMPNINEGRSNYPNHVYLKPEEIYSRFWLNKINLFALNPNAYVREIQSINEFNNFSPMELIATENEVRNLKNEYKESSFIVFPEDRMFPIKMNEDLPYRWIEMGPSNIFRGEGSKGEYFTFQLGVYAQRKLSNLKIVFTDLRSLTGDTIPNDLIECINTGGINYKGEAFTKKVDVENGKIQAMWCGINIPADIEEGTYTGKAIVFAVGTERKEIDILLKVTDQVSEDGGANEPWKQTRLKWLNSTIAQEETVIAPYVPIIVAGKDITLLGRRLRLGNNGLPQQIESYFTEEMTGYNLEPKNILSAPMELIGLTPDGEIKWVNQGINFVSKTDGKVSWEAFNSSDKLSMDIKASIEFDGFVAYQIKITSLDDIELQDIRLKIPYNISSSRYIMGLGLKGGLRPAAYEWKWDVALKNQDGAWIGDINAGLQYSLRDNNYLRPLNTNFYLQKPLLLPKSWGNEGKGGISISEAGESVLVNCYSGTRTLKKGEVLFYNFNLLITPFHTINTNSQWEDRYYHKYSPVDTVKEKGATIINIHHANEINPYINYPFIAHQKMKEYIDEAHAKGMKVKIYNTIRELSNRAYELFPLRSLIEEIFTPGNGGGFSWLQEHLGNNYIPAWFVPSLKDAAIINSGMSRWHNYYVEGLNWLVKNVGIDGLYIDDVAFDRTTMKRVKRVLTKDGHPGIIDLHSANQYNERDGYINSAMLYLEHFPYLNRLWFGEYFDYENNSPEFFLIEISGIPFGLMGEMLEKGGNPWRGMLYGMTNRMPWTENSDPRPIWKVWDDFGMIGSEMIGYWVSDCPVTTNNEKVLATVYKKRGKCLVSIASWADSDVNVKLNIDWSLLGINPETARIEAPFIRDFQQAQTFSINDNIMVEKEKGWLLLIK